MKKHEQLMLIAAKSNIPVLLQGESGVGKEIAARFIHEHSPRSEGPFVALNCGAIARNLAESLLEGAKKGSYTGAASDHQGIVQAANGGTLSGGKRRHAIPRRNRRNAIRHAEQAFTHLAGTFRAPARGHAKRAGRLQAYMRHKPRLAKRNPQRELPQGPVLQAERLPHRDPAAPQPGRLRRHRHSHLERYHSKDFCRSTPAPQMGNQGAFQIRLAGQYPPAEKRPPALRTIKATRNIA